MSEPQVEITDAVLASTRKAIGRRASKPLLRKVLEAALPLLDVVPADRLREVEAERDALNTTLTELKRTAEGLLGDRERALESDRHRIRADDMQALSDTYAEALRWYADKANWEISGVASSPARKDNGERARAALRTPGAQAPLSQPACSQTLPASEPNTSSSLPVGGEADGHDRPSTDGEIERLYELLDDRFVRCPTAEDGDPPRWGLLSGDLGHPEDSEWNAVGDGSVVDALRRLLTEEYVRGLHENPPGLKSLIDQAVKDAREQDRADVPSVSSGEGTEARHRIKLVYDAADWPAGLPDAAAIAGHRAHYEQEKLGNSVTTQVSEAMHAVWAYAVGLRAAEESPVGDGGPSGHDDAESWRRLRPLIEAYVSDPTLERQVALTSAAVGRWESMLPDGVVPSVEAARRVTGEGESPSADLLIVDAGLPSERVVVDDDPGVAFDAEVEESPSGAGVRDEVWRDHENALHGIRFAAQTAYLGFHHLDPDADNGDKPIHEQAADVLLGLAQRACDALGMENTP